MAATRGGTLGRASIVHPGHGGDRCEVEPRAGRSVLAPARDGVRRAAAATHTPSCRSATECASRSRRMPARRHRAAAVGLRIRRRLAMAATECTRSTSSSTRASPARAAASRSRQRRGDRDVQPGRQPLTRAASRPGGARSGRLRRLDRAEYLRVAITGACVATSRPGRPIGRAASASNIPLGAAPNGAYCPARPRLPCRHDRRRQAGLRQAMRAARSRFSRPSWPRARSAPSPSPPGTGRCPCRSAGGGPSAGGP